MKSHLSLSSVHNMLEHPNQIRWFTYGAVALRASAPLARLPQMFETPKNAAGVGTKNMFLVFEYVPGKFCLLHEKIYIYIYKYA